MKPKKTIVENVPSLSHATSNTHIQQQLHTITAADLDAEMSHAIELYAATTPEDYRDSALSNSDILQRSSAIETNVFSLFGPTPQITAPAHIHDCDNLTEAQLKKKYRREHNTFRSRRSAAKTDGIPFYESWEKSFAAFLRHHGPKGDPSFTLHKKIPEQGYVPGNTAWAGKVQQTWERPNTIMVSDKDENIPLGVWADRHGISRDICYRKHHAGWSLEEIIAGSRQQTASVKFKAPPFNHPWPLAYTLEFELAYQRDTAGGADRLWYLAHKAAKSLKALSNEIESSWFPDDYSPTPEEQQAHDTLTKQLALWQGFWRHAQRRVEERGGSLSIDDHCLNRYR